MTNLRQSLVSILLCFGAVSGLRAQPDFRDAAPCPLNSNYAAPAPGSAFDWRQPTYKLYMHTNRDTLGRDFPSPWYTNGNPNVARLRAENPKDNAPEAGWVLVTNDLGTPRLPINHPYLVLYNQRTATLRVFVAIGRQIGTHKSAQLTLSYGGLNQEDVKQTAILENYPLRNGLSALNNFDNTPRTVRVPNSYAGASPFWLHADFKLHYDPCTCNSLSQLYCQADLIDSWPVGAATATGVYPYLTIIIDLPGSNNGKSLPEAGKRIMNNPPTRTIYNEIMGVLTLLTTPEVRYRRDFRDHYSTYAYRLTEDWQYVVNPAAGTDLTLSAALVISFDDSLVTTTNLPKLTVRDRNYRLTQEDTRTYRSPYVPLGCLKDLEVAFNTNDARPGQRDRTLPAHRALVRVRATDPRTNAVVYQGDYATLSRFDGFSPADQWGLNLMAINAPRLRRLTNETVRQNLDVSDTLIIGPGVMVQGGPYVLRANVFRVEPGAVVPTGLTLLTGAEPVACGRNTPPASADQIKATCNGSQYRTLASGNLVSSRAGWDLATHDFPYPKSLAQLYLPTPNPFDQTTVLHYQLTRKSAVKLSVSDVLGRSLTTLVDETAQDAGQYSVPFNAGYLAPGVYVYTLETPGARQSGRLLLMR